MTGDTTVAEPGTEASSAPLTLLGAPAAAACEGDACDIPDPVKP